MYISSNSRQDSYSSFKGVDLKKLSFDLYVKSNKKKKIVHLQHRQNEVGKQIHNCLHEKNGIKTKK